MSEQEPETKDRLGKNVKNSISDDLSINTPFASTVSNAPDDWVESPEDEGEATNGSEKSSGLSILGLDCTTAWNDKLVDDNEVGNTSYGVVSPFLSIRVAKGSEETEENHDEVCYDGDEDVCSVQASEEGEIQEQERSSQGPVDVTGPKDLAEDMLDGVGDIVLVGFSDDDVGIGVSVTGSHGEVGDGGESGDE